MPARHDDQRHFATSEQQPSHPEGTGRSRACSRERRPPRWRENAKVDRRAPRRLQQGRNMHRGLAAVLVPAVGEIIARTILDRLCALTATALFRRLVES
jgi:hypothetical protein